MNASSIENSIDLSTFLKTSDQRLLRVREVAQILCVSPETVYDWKYRSSLRKVPIGLFVKIGRILFIRGDVLRAWIFEQMKETC